MKKFITKNRHTTVYVLIVTLVIFITLAYYLLSYFDLFEEKTPYLELNINSHAHNFTSVSLEFSPDGNSLSAIDNDNISIWHVPNLTLSRKLIMDGYYPIVATWSPDGKLIATTNEEGQIKIWDVQTGSVRLGFQISSTSLAGNIAFSPDGNLLAVGKVQKDDKQKTEIRRVKDGTFLKSVDGYIGGFNGAHEIWVIIRNRTDALLQIQNLDDATIKKTFTFLEDDGLAFSPNYKVLAVIRTLSRSKAAIQFYDTTDGHLISQDNEMNDTCEGFSFSPDGNFVACGRASIDSDHIEQTAKSPSIEVRSVKNAKVERNLKGQSRNILNAVYSPNGKYLASYSIDLTIRLWTLKA